MTNDKFISFVISTFNRRDVLLGTLARLRDCEIEHEIFVVDNASGDGAADAVRETFPQVHLIVLAENRGSCAKNVALPHCRGEYIVFLDDDSYPERGSMARMMEYFQAKPDLGAAGFTVSLPNGSRECSAYPDVFIGCGAGFRREALQEAGGLPDDFFMQAEEYDLSLRMLDAGWDIRTFGDLHVTHLKTPGARFSKRTTRLDVRNNLVLIARYFPEKWVWPYLREWTRRYWAIASSKGHRLAFWSGLADASVRIVRGVGRRPISEKIFERFARIEETRKRLTQVSWTPPFTTPPGVPGEGRGGGRSAFSVQRSVFPNDPHPAPPPEHQAREKERHGELKNVPIPIRKILFADYGKNILAYRLAAEACGMEIVAIADANLGGRGFTYRGIPIVEDRIAGAMDFDAVIVSNLSPVHGARAAERWRRQTDRPVIDLFGGDNAVLRTSAK